VRGEATVAEIKTATGNSHVEVLIADLASQASIRLLAEAVQRKYDRLHVLINNAAVVKSTRTVTADGLETMFAVNHLAPFLLTNLLLDRLRASTPASIFTVAAPSTVQLNFDDLQSERQFNALRAFGATKMGNLLFSFALARRLQTTGVTANAYHPGIARSNLMREAPAPMRLFTGVLNLFGSTPARAVEGLVQLAASNANGVSGQLFHGVKPIDVALYAHDEQVQERLWAASAQLVGLAT
jgi:NAD(P)-dependent dehydrogenase (short-subunit alcohol dehydrogenase family)